MTGSIKTIVQAALRPFNLQLVRASVNPKKIGMDVCLKGLADRKFLPEVVLDVGAATGQWTRLALNYWPTARYFLIEPLDERRAAQDELAREHPNVSWILAAAGSNSGQLPIGVLPDFLDGSSFLYGEEFRTVDVVTLDDLMQSGRIEQPQFMKLDVQGYELNVLEGARRTLAGSALLLLELQFFRFTPAMKLIHESIDWMVNKHYRPYEIAGVLRRPYDGAMGQCDVLFVHEDHWLATNSAWS